MSKKVRLEDAVGLFEKVFEEGGEVSFVTSGISMIPMLGDGTDKVYLVKACGPLKKNDVPLVRRKKDGSFVLHRVVGTDGDGYILRGDNQWFCERGIKHDQVIGVVTAFEKNGKRTDCKSPRYKMYCLFLPVIRYSRKYFYMFTDRLFKRKAEKEKSKREEKQ